MSDTVFASNNALLTQVQLEYEEGQDYLRAKKLNQVANLILFNNLQRDDQSITSTLLPSMFNRVFSNLYSDVLQAVFVPSEDSDFKKTEAISKMQQNDYQEMCIPDLNYDWTWDACFFGEGYLETLVFNRKTKLMEPYVVNPLYLTHDPFFENVREWRYYSIWMTFSTYQLERMKAKKVTGPDFDITRISPGLEVELWDYKNRRDAARLATNVNSSSMSKNNVYQILKHFTVLTEDHPDSQGKIIPKGNRVIVWTDKNFSQEIRVERLSKYIPEDEPWPLVRKQIFREPHSSTAISVPDLIQDKHRAQSVLMNLAYLAAQDDANPIYLYDKNHVDDPTQFMSRQIGQHVAVDDLNAAVKPMQTHAAMSAALSAFLSLLGSHSSEVIGTAIIQPTAQKGKKSATEAAMSQQIADLSASLQAKIVAMAEKEFWSQWYLRLANNMKQGDEKIVKLTSVTGITFNTIKFDEFKTKFPPKVQIKSKKEAEYKELVLRRDLMQNYPILTKTMDPRSLAHFNKYVYFPKFIDDSTTIDRIVPQSIDEIKARMENEMLDDNKFTPVLETDNDEDHMFVHLTAKHTPAMWTHYFIHEIHAAVKRKKEEEKQAQEEAQSKDQGTGGGNMDKNLSKNAPKQNQIPIQKDKQDPTKAAVPLAKETSNNASQKGRVLA